MSVQVLFRRDHLENLVSKNLSIGISLCPRYRRSDMAGTAVHLSQPSACRFLVTVHVTQLGVDLPDIP
jgi:hypothetical protein